MPTTWWGTHTRARELLADHRYEPLHIRPCTTRDRAGVIALWETVFADDPPHNAPAKVFDAKLAMHDGMLFAATDAGSVIGTAMAGYDGHRGWLYTVAVSPGHRRRGIGTALVRHAVAALRTAGCIKVNLQIRSSNLAVRGFYESLGFEAEDRLSMGMHIR
ncbi:MAG: GNAT family acetyltransferase [Chromatiales bacterium]|nr:GNAT family acetyltransferase [Chromatiales bacterium]